MLKKLIKILLSFEVVEAILTYLLFGLNFWGFFGRSLFVYSLKFYGLKF